MKPGCIILPSRIRVSTVREGKSIEEVVRQAMENNEPIQGNATLLYTDEKDGIRPEFDIRTDRWELALKASDRVHASNYAKRMQDMGLQMGEDGNWIPIPSEAPQAPQNDTKS